LAAAAVIMLGALALDVAGQYRAGLDPVAHAYGAAVTAVLTVQGLFAAALAIMAAYAMARSWRGLLDTVRRVTFDNTALLWHYTVAQGMIALVALHAMPRLVG
jgi:cytochrome c oxidase subunit I+III